jgi:hypothetical protein
VRLQAHERQAPSWRYAPQTTILIYPVHPVYPCEFPILAILEIDVSSPFVLPLHNPLGVFLPNRIIFWLAPTFSLAETFLILVTNS